MVPLTLETQRYWKYPIIFLKKWIILVVNVIIISFKPETKLLGASFLPVR